MMAIGFVAQNAMIPEGLMLRPLAGVAVVGTSAPSDPRSRLAALQKVFDAGTDIIPLSPLRVYPMDRAMEAAEAAPGKFEALLTAIEGRGQLMVSMPRLGQDSSVGNGRDWLQRRRDVHRAEERILDLLDSHQCHARRLPPRSGHAAVAGLVPRHRLMAMLDILRIGKPVGHLDVTGLWPAYAFVGGSFVA